jgi:hypothetical protein
MGIFRRREGMIDVVDMQRRGLIKLPARKPGNLKAGKDGFVELTGSPATPSESAAVQPAKQEKAGGWFGGFFGGEQSSPQPNQGFSTETDGYNKREVDAKIEELDNKIYKIEQRLEVLERKNSVGAWGSS